MYLPVATITGERSERGSMHATSASVPGQTIQTILARIHHRPADFARKVSKSSIAFANTEFFDLPSPPARAQRLTTSGCFPSRPPIFPARCSDRSRQRDRRRSSNRQMVVIR
jgi:hypothetical protein